MSDQETLRPSDAEHARLKLADGLKACRAVVASYRVMLGAEANDNLPQGAVNDELFHFAEPHEADEA